MMPPLFALGYHHTHRSYKEAKTLLDLSAAFAREQIPVDTLGLGLNHTNGKHIFTWNRVHFPDPVEMQQQLWRDGGRFLVLSTVPYVSADPRFALYLEGRRHEYFVTAHPEEDDLFMGLTATGLMTWVDFLNPGARRWYGGLLKYKRFVGSTNHTFFSLEENEPFVPNGMRETLPAESGHAGAVPHSEVHNIYGMLHAMTVYKGQLRRTHFHRRPFVMTQSFFAGVQRYAAVRLGHTTASWEHLQASVEGCLMHSIAGIPFVGTDIGGFFHQPDDELLVRWYQLGAFYPLFRADADAAVPLREAWLFAAHTRARIRDAVRLRYTLLPYLYTLFWRAHVHGELILRPLFFVYQQDPLVYVEPAMLTQRFFFGPHLFVAPIVTPAVGSSAPKMLQMPAEELYNFWTGELVASGAILQVSQKLSTSKSPEEKDIVPLFQRVGAILPTFTDVSGMRSTHDAANYTLTITLPRLLPLVISPSLPSRGVNSTLLLAQGELFVDGGSSYVDYHNLNGTRRVACVLAFECSLLPNRSYLQVQWRTTASSSCGEVLDELRGTSVGVSGPDAFLITRLRLLFATPDDSERVVGGGRATGGDGQELSLLKVSDHLVEVLGLAVPLLTNYGGDEDDNNSNGNVPRLVAAMRLG
ncbi:putative glycosyl hydrolase-like protein [Trypanosoma grayi]|uniref:putative glycosyl hydrolase-like protein n=1 Tax=Trypanosoma grayi TaxID=71804 RepID=UPI0004F499B6|nr:putative glycosyl hydrolase-like protein [Trypanosoma grayi]KEG09436.1 putative glycosyl hydrolase-like protein [Trypanosoma grayi]